MVGSARSPESFDLYGFLTGIDEEYPGLIERWGGHAQAAGITIRVENFERFRSVVSSRYADLMREHLESQETSGAVSPFDGEFILTSEAYDRLIRKASRMRGRPSPSTVTRQSLRIIRCGKRFGFLNNLSRSVTVFRNHRSVSPLQCRMCPGCSPWGRISSTRS